VLTSWNASAQRASTVWPRLDPSQFLRGARYVRHQTVWCASGSKRHQIAGRSSVNVGRVPGESQPGRPRRWRAHASVRRISANTFRNRTLSEPWECSRPRWRCWDLLYESRNFCPPDSRLALVESPPQELEQCSEASMARAEDPKLRKPSRRNAICVTPESLKRRQSNGD